VKLLQRDLQANHRQGRSASADQERLFLLPGLEEAGDRLAQGASPDLLKRALRLERKAQAKLTW